MSDKYNLIPKREGSEIFMYTDRLTVRDLSDEGDNIFIRLIRDTAYQSKFIVDCTNYPIVIVMFFFELTI